MVWQYVHRAAALSGVTLVVLHVVTLLADSYADVGVLGLLPFGSGFKPLAVTFGVLAAYALAAVAVTGALRSRIATFGTQVRLWRRIHLLSYAAWALFTAHFLLVRTDTGKWWSVATLVAGATAVAVGVIARVSERRLADRRATVPVGAGR